MKYRITLVQTIYEGATLDIEADTQRAAEEIAQRMADEGSPAVEWKFAEAQGDPEITSVEEWPPQRDEPPEGTVINLIGALRRTLE
jgi:hypothetical protein